jgi:hypothetical protein
MADPDPTTTKPLLPTDAALEGVYRAALDDVPQGAIERPAAQAARAILARFTPQPHQAARWLEMGLAQEIHRLLVMPYADDDEC